MKIKSLNFMFYFLLASLAMFSLSDCNFIYPNITSSQIPILATPQYMHYTAPKDSNIHIEFDYPSSWVFNQDLQFQTLKSIYLGDQRFRSLPTPSFEESHPASRNFGRIVFLISSIDSDQSLDAEAERYKLNTDEYNGVVFLSESAIVIDGHEAIVLESIGPGENDPSLVFERRISFIVNDQIYIISFTVAENERGGDFEQGYEYFFNSLKIVP